MRKQPTPENKLIGELEYLFLFYYWARDRVLRKEQINVLHLTLWRRAALAGRVVPVDIRAVTGRSKADIAKAGKFLLTAGMLEVLHLSGDRRCIHLKCTEKGFKRLRKIDREIEEQFLQILDVGRGWRTEEFATGIERVLRKLGGAHFSNQKFQMFEEDYEAYFGRKSGRKAATEDDSDVGTVFDLM